MLFPAATVRAMSAAFLYKEAAEARALAASALGYRQRAVGR
jgi:hypothetical protein